MDPLNRCRGSHFNTCKNIPSVAFNEKTCLSGVLYVFTCITEASYTLLLYDELLEWSDRPLREFLNYPMQSEWQRKEYLHLTIIQNFDRGKVSWSWSSLLFFFLHILLSTTFGFYMYTYKYSLFAILKH